MSTDHIKMSERKKFRHDLIALNHAIKTIFEELTDPLPNVEHTRGIYQISQQTIECMIQRLDAGSATIPEERKGLKSCR